jgi:hypothetical protein
MDPTSSVATAKAMVSAGEIAYKGWGWFTRMIRFCFLPLRHLRR